MTREMKFITLKKESSSMEMIHLFPAMVSHQDFWVGIRRVLSDWKPIRAGFVQLEAGTLVCYGFSESLKLEADKQLDTDLLNSQLNQDYSYERQASSNG